MVDVAFELGAVGLIRRLQAMRQTGHGGQRRGAPSDLAQSRTTRHILIHI